MTLAVMTRASLGHTGRLKHAGNPDGSNLRNGEFGCDPAVSRVDI